MVQIDSWVSNSGKNGMRRDFLVRDYCSGFVLARATRYFFSSQFHAQSDLHMYVFVCMHV